MKCFHVCSNFSLPVLFAVVVSPLKVVHTWDTLLSFLHSLHDDSLFIYNALCPLWKKKIWKISFLCPLNCSSFSMLVIKWMIKKKKREVYGSSQELKHNNSWLNFMLECIFDIKFSIYIFSRIDLIYCK